jgi:hypothetical protein
VEKGIETFNPFDGAIETLVDEMPMEIGHTTGLQLSKIISTNKNTELVFFGGWSGYYTTDVWKYKYVSNKWELLGNIQISRINHLAIPVIGMKCP